MTRGAPVGDAAANAVEHLRAEIARHARLVVAFSGGVDSALVARVATDVLGADAVLCVTAVSASLAPGELEECGRLAAEWGLRFATVATGELEDPAYVRNDLDRCARCKDALMDALAPLAAREKASVALGVNLDDLGEHRPGQGVARRRGAVFPLVAAGLTKNDVRAASRLLGLRTWDKPAAACLASRLPHGTAVTVGRLAQVGRAEAALRRLGFRQLRVRHLGDTARVEVALEEMPLVLERRGAVVEALHDAGYRHLTLDLEGFRSGNLARAALAERAGDPRAKLAR